ncbi:hypothetical protein ABK864_01395 [Serratia marcescens]|uniref:DUF7210 family protein n=1 Tax=Serratia marcescens TaxID=615 RepID=UPI00374F78B7
MKLIALKPIYFGGDVVREGCSLETREQHGRELIKKGYAKPDDGEATTLSEIKVDKKAKK